MTMTLEQQRAADAWHRAQGCTDEYVRLAKGAPALIMNSGLIQVLAIFNEKGEKGAENPHRQLGAHLRAWLSARFGNHLPRAEFESFMPALMDADPQLFQHITTEAVAWLRWMRQIAPACRALNDSTGH